MRLRTYQLNEFNFEHLLDCITRCYALEFQDKLPKTSDFPASLVESEDELNLNALLDYTEAIENVFMISIIKRIVGVAQIQNARDNQTNLDSEFAWKMIYDSIKIIPSEATISSIGSQGFLSIPLFKSDSNMEKFDFIRLHIWHNDLLEFIDPKKSELFSIHSHSFRAKSWILFGRLINERYSVEKTGNSSSDSLFKVEYNKTLNEVNQHTSMAVNTGQNVLIKKTGTEEYGNGDTYEVAAGHFHKSISKGENGLTSTFFSFTTQNSKVEQSHVTGPSDIDESSINRKMHLDPKRLLDEINSKTREND
jgi:hypothetical protein